ncbi:MAG: NYN domain-containing protein [Gemmatimonadaceae bacterium]
MNSRNPRTSTRSQSALIHRGPDAVSIAANAVPSAHAPNAALLIDFDNVTMGIRSDLGKELRSLLSSEIIKGKVAVQRAYADWRRYPQYVVPLAESSIDMIMAPAYGSSKKNATDIRLAIDAIELVFARPQIGTYILLSGDSDFSSLVMKLKEYGKYVIGVGIRESSSDLLVQNCDEYYSYNALAGLVKANDEEPTRKYDPWELVTEAVQRMKRNNDVMRSDRLKQVMQEIDGTFDEKNLGISKFSRFCQEAAQRGLLAVMKLENGQLEVDLPGATPPSEAGLVRPEAVAAAIEGAAATSASDDRPRRSRRGRGGRGREREDRPRTSQPAGSAEGAPQRTGEHAVVAPAAQLELTTDHPRSAPASAPVQDAAPLAAPVAAPAAASLGERLTRAEAFELVRRTVADLAPGDESVRASVVQQRARELLGRDSESLSERMFVRILKDAHDAGLLDLRRRGDDFEVARAANAASVAEQLARTEQAAVAASAPATSLPTAPRIGMGPRGAGSRGGAGPRGRGAPPAHLLSIGVVDHGESAAALPAAAAAAPAAQPEAVATEATADAAPRARGKRAKPAAKAKRPSAPPATKKAAPPRAKKKAAKKEA